MAGHRVASAARTGEPGGAAPSRAPSGALPDPDPPGTGASAAAAPAPERSAEPGRPSGPVILIDWDGVAPSYLDEHLDACAPVLSGLMWTGSHATMGGTYKSVSNPNRASAATGARPEVHRNTAYVLDPATGKARGQTRTMRAETLAEALRRQGRTVLSAGWYIVEDRGTAYGDPEGLYTQARTWEENVDAVAAALRGEPVDSDGTPVRLPRIPDLIAAYSADLDTIGHREGPRSPRIPERLSGLDAGLGRIVAEVRRAGLLGRTTFVLVSDHGMTGYTRSLEPAVFRAITGAGFSVERLYSGQAPDPATEVVLTASPRAANAYLRGAAAAPEGRARLLRALHGLDELEAVLTREDLDALGAAPEEGDLTLDARPPFAFIDPDAVGGTERGGHASLREAHAPLTLSGPDVRARGRLCDPGIIDVAPTVCRLLGAAPPAHAQGRVLDEVLVPRRA
ncbi:alkaline phosphatase family protein [Nocardiopsis suaedae]|uniref:Alkaline phosphatase family protein n=1 Tax=Nocardiopsis suaedae TaxID=3018444 RepID=A0ABT4TED6_9ACTN|nr:alkaline phosphatase family protein [Nocardiopsis suaedae]MDA2803068.1 alkaline phosphatase family protein [Nocardiopsis suaedae]